MVVLRAKFRVSSFVRYGDMERSQNLRSNSRDPGHPHFDPILHFFLVPLRIILRTNFGVSSFVRYGDIDGVPKNKKVGHATQATPLLTQFYIHLLSTPQDRLTCQISCL